MKSKKGGYCKTYKNQTDSYDKSMGSILQQGVERQALQ